MRVKQFGLSAFLSMLVLMVLLGASSVLAQAFPNRTMTLYVTTSAGGTLDLMARLFADRLRRRSEQTIVVENRPGAGGNLAYGAVAASRPDGHSIVLGGNQLQSLFVKNLGYDPALLTPVSILSQTPFTLVASKASNLRNFAEFLAFAKANPGKLTLGAVPLGAHELDMHALEFALNIRTNVIGYKGFAPLEAAVLAGEIDASLFGNIAKVKSGQIVAIVTAGDRRSPDMPDVPTFKELGIAHDPRASYTVWTRSGVPADVMARLVKECQDLVASPEYTSAITERLGIQAIASTREVALQTMSAEFDRMKTVAERVGIKPQ